MIPHTLLYTDTRKKHTDKNIYTYSRRLSVMSKKIRNMMIIDKSITNSLYNTRHASSTHTYHMGLYENVKKAQE